METENLIEKYLRDQAKVYNCLVYKWTSPAQRGVPDDLVIWPGGIVHCVELKTATGKLSDLQLYHLNKLTNHGLTCFVLYGKADVYDYFQGNIDSWHL